MIVFYKNCTTRHGPDFSYDYLTILYRWYILVLQSASWCFCERLGEWCSQSSGNIASSRSPILGIRTKFNGRHQIFFLDCAYKKSGTGAGVGAQCSWLRQYRKFKVAHPGNPLVCFKFTKFNELHQVFVFSRSWQRCRHEGLVKAVQCHWWYNQPEAQKPKTFRVATFYAQKLSGRSARNRFSRQA